MNTRLRRRLVAVSALALAALTGIILFWTAQNVQSEDSQLHQLQGMTANERESLRVLRAEWDYLNRPDRLEALARQQLKMSPPTTGTVAGHDAPPAKPKPIKPTPPTLTTNTTSSSPPTAIPAHPTPPAAPNTPQQKDFNSLLKSLDKNG